MFLEQHFLFHETASFFWPVMLLHVIALLFQISKNTKKCKGECGCSVMKLANHRSGSLPPFLQQKKVTALEFNRFTKSKNLKLLFMTHFLRIVTQTWAYVKMAQTTVIISAWRVLSVSGHIKCTDYGIVSIGGRTLDEKHSAAQHL